MSLAQSDTGALTAQAGSCDPALMWRNLVRGQAAKSVLDVESIARLRARTVATRHCLPLVRSVLDVCAPGASVGDIKRRMAEHTGLAWEAAALLGKKFQVPVIEGSPLHESVFAVVLALVASDLRRGRQFSAAEYADLCAGVVSQDDVNRIGALAVRQSLVKDADDARQFIALSLMREGALLASEGEAAKGSRLTDAELENVYRLSDRAVDLALEQVDPEFIHSTPERFAQLMDVRLNAAFELLRAMVKSIAARHWPPAWGDLEREFERAVRILDSVVSRQLRVFELRSKERASDGRPTAIGELP